MSPAPQFIGFLGGGLRWGFFLFIFFISLSAPAESAVVAPRTNSPIAKLQLPANSMADNMSGVAYGMAGLGAIGLIIMSLMGRWPWGYFFAYVGSLAFLAIMPEFYGSIQKTYSTDVGGFAYQDSANQAKASKLFATTENLADSVSVSLKKVLYGAGAFGTLGIAAVSFLSGRFRWGWMMAMMGGLTLTAQLADVVEVMAGVPAANFANPTTSISDTPIQPLNF